MEIHLLDVGDTKYGDCILVTHGDRAILIDAAHPGDFSRIRGQLAELFGHEPPFKIDLLVITHCHLDHIGCCPRLVDEDILEVGVALVADERLGWGKRTEDAADPLDEVPPPARKVILALQEEPLDDAPADEVLQFIEDAATLEENYQRMLGKLRKVVRYGSDRQSAIDRIERDFADFGLKILGPTVEHLRICRDLIHESNSDGRADLADAALTDDAASLVDAYRRAVERRAEDGARRFADAPAEDRPGVGAAKNNQSIVLKLEAGGFTALLAGDMQFAKPQVPGLDDDMEALQERVVQNGPYDFIKLTHHSSYNGLDEDVLAAWQPTTCFAHTGGRNDAGHPDKGVLDLLKRFDDEITFARTDRNGLISVRKVDGQVEMSVARGRLNNFEKNTLHDVIAAVAEEPAAEAVEVVAQPAVVAGEFVEVSARIPHRATRVTITVDVEPGVKKND